MTAATDVDTLLGLMPPPPDGGLTVDWEEIARSWDGTGPLRVDTPDSLKHPCGQ
jgi:hypothetical protein